MRLELLQACAISITALGCTSHPADSSTAVPAEPALQASQDAALSGALREVAIARWEGVRSLARQLPGRAVLAVELYRTPQDQTLAVFTTVGSGEPVRSAVIGDAHGVVQPAEIQAETIERIASGTATPPAPGSVDPSVVALGQPPPRQPPEPGIVAAASDVLATAFASEALATGERMHPPLTLAAARVVGRVNAGASVDQATLAADVDMVMAARWEGFRSLAQHLPDRELLSVELIRTRQDQTVAVFVVVEHGAPVKYAMLGDALGNLRTTGAPAGASQGTATHVEVVEDGIVDPAVVALGRPPPIEPTTPGIAAAGQGLLSAVFQRVVAPPP